MQALCRVSSTLNISILNSQWRSQVTTRQIVLKLWAKFRAPKNFKSRVFFQLSVFPVILRIPWWCPNGDRSVIFNALTNQCMALAFPFSSLTRGWETFSKCVHKREPLHSIIMMLFHYNSGTEFKGWHWFLVSGTLPPFAVSIALGSIGAGSPTHRSDSIKQQVTVS